MAKTLRYRLFKVGALPENLRTQIQNDQVLFLEEGLPVTVRRKGAGPGFRGSSIGIFSGAFAVTNQRLVASISKTVVVNAAYDTQGTQRSEASLTKDGLHITIDASIRPQWTGEIRLHFKQDFSEEELARFPNQTIRFQFPVDLIPKMFGVPG